MPKSDQPESSIAESPSPGGGSRVVDRVLWATSVVILAVDAWFSLGPPPPTPGVPDFDKVLHAVGYAGLCGVTLLAAVWRPGRGAGRFRWAAPAVVAGVCALVVGMELVQAMLPRRDAEFLDGVAGVGGALVAYQGWSVLRRRARAAVSSAP